MQHHPVTDSCCAEKADIIAESVFAPSHVRFAEEADTAVAERIKAQREKTTSSKRGRASKA
jgi:hypothetical protein